MIKAITIDGPASSGKSSLSRLLSKKLNWPWWSTGVLYRGLAYVGFKENLSPQGYLHFFQSKNWHIHLTDSKSLFFYKGRDISSKLDKGEMDERASLFSSNPLFRKALIPVQKQFFQPYLKKGIIMEGRDCGTVLCPSAPLKVFLSASSIERAKRRAKDRNQDQSTVFQAQKIRDKRDQNRPFAPLIPPKNALCLDSSKKSAMELSFLVYKKAQSLFSL